jgi:hypothetical protein
MALFTCLRVLSTSSTAVTRDVHHRTLYGTGHT